MSLKLKIISTEKAPAAVGPYSQAVQVGDFIYTAGQIPLVPESGKLIEGSIEDQTQQIMENLKNILEAAGTDLSYAVKSTIFLTDMADFAAVNKIYGAFFGDNPPARSTVQVAALPLEAKVEIEIVAVSN